MTDQPSPGSAAPDPQDAASAPASPPPPLAPLVDAAAGATPPPAEPAPSGYPVPSGDPVPPAPSGWTPAEQAPPPPMPATPTATGKDKLRLALIFGGIAVFLVVVLFAALNNENADELAIGQCFNEPSGEEFSTVEKRECTQEHDGEVFHVAQMPGGDSYPIDLTFQSFVAANCFPVFQTYTGIAYESSTELDVAWFYPNRNGWEDGKRTVTCYVYRLDGAKMTQSVKAGS